MPVFYRVAERDLNENVVQVKIFRLMEGQACIVSWALPEPGLRSFTPTLSEPDAAQQALPYAQFLRDHLGASRVSVEMDDGMDWNPAWGRLIG